MSYFVTQSIKNKAVCSMRKLRSHVATHNTDYLLLPTASGGCSC